MLQEPFPDLPPDDDEPAAFDPADDISNPWPDDPDGPGQGLFLTLPPGQLTLTGFAQNGEADTMTPGPLLATVMGTVTGEDGSGLAVCSDDQLTGIISAARRQRARDEWTLLSAVGEFTRRAGEGLAAGFAADELAFELHLSQASAAGQMDYASTVAARLPKTFAALAAGLIDPFHLRIIEEQTRILSDADAAKADGILAAAAADMTYGELRYAARKLVLSLDPDAVRKQKEAARRDTQVRRFREESGNGGLVARELPSDELLASWQHIEERALDLRAVGHDGTLEELRVRAFLDLLQGRHAHPQPAADQPPPGTTPPSPGPDARPSLAAHVTLTIPLATWQGRAEIPGDADGYGPLDGDDSRDLAAAAARHPSTRWCLTALNPDGTAAAHACLRGRHPPPLISPPGAGPPGTGPPGPFTMPPLTPITRGPCDHARAETGYRPSRKLAHLIRARSARCTAPGCCRPAARCDLDHTVPWDQGGLTCECGLAPLCRRHHRCKQAEGWHLTQPGPGILTWRVPSGRTYTTNPTRYSL